MSQAAPPVDPPTAPTVLVVDDEKNIRRTLEMVLSGEGFQVRCAESAEAALRLVDAGHEPVDLVLLDLKLPGMDGHACLEKLRAEETTRDLPVVVMSGHASVNDAVKAIKLGASDFIEKPLLRERVLVSVRNALDAARARRALAEVAQEQLDKYEMVGRSAPMLKVFREIERVAPTKASVLITGESGTGKELISRAIHRLGPRTKGPFVKVNCAAIPRELIESELFGHEKGSFTGATQRKRGLFEQAHGGTLFLDEIGDMDLLAQAKVLRALQSGEVLRVGSEHVLHVDVRILAATNKDLAKEVERGAFREDLYFRLAVFPLRSPALRERREDIPLLVDAFLTQFCKENGLRKKGIMPEAMTALVARSWPGNVRELRNAVERMAILSDDVITIADLPEDPHASPFDDDAPSGPLASSVDEEELDDLGAEKFEFPPLPPGTRPTLREYRELAERHHIVDTLRALDWNVSRAAIVLGVERTNLHKKIRTYGIKRES
jgi:two-component system, NtrC family, nitrogen regulation response regulator NtrX